jgi:hypothetical protein
MAVAKLVLKRVSLLLQVAEAEPDEQRRINKCVGQAKSVLPLLEENASDKQFIESVADQITPMIGIVPAEAIDILLQGLHTKKVKKNTDDNRWKMQDYCAIPQFLTMAEWEMCKKQKSGSVLLRCVFHRCAQLGCTHPSEATTKLITAMMLEQCEGLDNVQTFALRTLQSYHASTNKNMETVHPECKYGHFKGAATASALAHR